MSTESGNTIKCSGECLSVSMANDVVFLDA